MKRDKSSNPTKTPKLRLERKTLRRLDDAQLADVNGGRGNSIETLRRTTGAQR